MFSSSLQKNIITLLELEALPLEQKFHVLSQMTELIEQRVLNRIMDAVPPAERASFIAAVEGHDPQTMEQYIAQYIPDMNQLINEETLTLKKELFARKQTLDL